MSISMYRLISKINHANCACSLPLRFSCDAKKNSHSSNRNAYNCLKSLSWFWISDQRVLQYLMDYVILIILLILIWTVPTSTNIISIQYEWDSNNYYSTTTSYKTEVYLQYLRIYDPCENTRSRARIIFNVKLLDFSPINTNALFVQWLGPRIVVAETVVRFYDRAYHRLRFLSFYLFIFIF